MKLSSQMTDTELRKEIYNLRRDLRQRLGEVRAEAKTSPTFYHESADTDRKIEKKIIARSALEHFKEAEKTMRKTAVRDMDTKQLRNMYRDLKYIAGLKSSTLEGATITASRYDPFAKTMESLSEDMRNLVWDVYSKLYAERGTGLERYKYEIFESGLTQEITPANAEQLAQTLSDLLKETEAYAEPWEKNLYFARRLSEVFGSK